MKILSKSKRAVPPPPQVAEVISHILATPNDDISDALEKIDSWKWPRTDLSGWIKVLNKFDAILEQVVRDYDMDKLQTNVFTPATKRTVAQILRFERLLLENSTNRKTFHSYDRLNSLLFTSDLDILILALNLLLRPSQQYSSQPSATHTLSISTHRLQSLAKRWPSLREHGVGLADLVASEGGTKVDDLPTEAREVHYTFYRTDNKEPVKDSAKEQGADVFETPRKASVPAPSSGAINIYIDEQSLASKEAVDILADAVETHNVPDEEKYELFCRIRSASVLVKGREAEREKLVIARLLATAIYAHTHSETQASTSLFMYEPDLLTHVAELLQLDRGISIPVQTAAIAVLDAIAKYRGKAQEVLAAVNAGVNHGILMALVRKTVTDLGNPESVLPQSFVEALLSFLTFITMHSAGGNMLVGAGLVPLLIQIIETRHPHRLPIVSKTMQLIDNVLYSFNNAFQLFTAARGVQALVDRIEFEVDLDIADYGSAPKARNVAGTHSQLPVARAAILKHTLRSMHRMMQSSGTAEGLRGLIDMTILKSIKKVMEHRGAFGPSVLPLAINIMSTFVHNEPTSLGIIQEAGLPEVFYRLVDVGLETNIEVIQAVANAIGALCLNQTGQDQLASRPSVIPAIFAIFTSDKHTKVLSEKENSILIGTSMDELIRHHPSLKESVFASLISTLSKIEEMGNDYAVPADIQQWYKLLPNVVETPTMSTAEGDVTMEGVEGSPAESAESAPPAPKLESDEPAPPKSHDNQITNYLDLVCRFLEGLFQHIPHCRDFIASTDGLKRLGRLTAMPCLPYDFANSMISDSFVQVMRTMTEVSTAETLLFLAGLVKNSLDETRPIWQACTHESKLLPLVDFTDENKANDSFRKLVTLNLRATILSDVFTTAGYQHGRAAVGLLSTIMGGTSGEIIPDLGALHRFTIWENLYFNAGLVAAGIAVPVTPSSTPVVARSPAPAAAAPLPDVEPVLAPNAGEAAGLANAAVVSALPSEDASMAEASEVSAPVAPPAVKSDGPRELNANALKHLTHGIPSTLAPFFTAIVKMFSARRHPEPSQKKQILEASKVLAHMMLVHFQQPEMPDATSRFTYYSVMFSLFSILLIDERNAQNPIYTVLLAAFYKIGGMDTMVSVCRQFIGAIERLGGRDKQLSTDESEELERVYGALKVATSLLLPMVTSKTILSSGQTTLIATPDKKPTDPDFFEPHNFVVKMRLAALPLIKDMWNASWIVDAPLINCRSIVKNVLEVIAAENETTPEQAAGGSAPQGAVAGGGRPPPGPPDENRIRQLMEMGFPRSAAERALARTHNNVNAATELLLSHPYPLPPDPEEAPAAAPVMAAVPVAPGAQETVEASTSDAESPASTSEDVEMEVALTPAEVVPEVIGKTPEEWRKELDDARAPMKAELGAKALALIDEHVSLIFDLHVAFVRGKGEEREAAVRKLVDDIKAFSPGAHDVQELPLSNRCRLLALVFAQAPSSMNAEARTSLMDSLLALLLSNTVNMENEHPTIPAWLAAHLLVTEALFTLSDQPRTTTVPSEGEVIPSMDVLAGPPFVEARTIVFDFCLRLLAVDNLPSNELLSVLRLFVLLTRDSRMAAVFVDRGGVNLLFQRLRSSSVSGSQSYIAIILRHIIEDVSVLSLIMRNSIKRFLTGPRTRIVDVTTYLRSCSAMALRNPATFVEVSQSLCQLAEPYSSAPHISLKPDVSSAPKTVVAPVDTTATIATTEMQVDVPLVPTAPSTPVPASVATAPSNEHLDGVIHFLIAELVKTAKPEQANEEATTTGPEATPKPSTSVSSALLLPILPVSDSAERNSYACFLMQCLTELLFSYDGCKLAFLSYSPKKRVSQTPAKEAANKYRTAALQFLLGDLINFATINPAPGPSEKTRISMAQWAISVVVALCVDSNHELKEVSPDLVSVRKFVLEAVSRALKDISPTESMDARYGRLLALADLCHRLLTVRSNPTSRKTDETPTHIAKVMLEKNFVATLTTALAEVDLNYPHVRGLVAGILRPLEHLSKIAIKMSRASGKAKDALETGKAVSEASFDSDDSDEEMDAPRGVREETPDLYRNSALGMYGGEMDDGHYPPDDEMDEDEEEDDEDVEMDFGEETGSEDTSNTDEEGDEEEDDGVNGTEEEWDEDEEEDEEALLEHGDQVQADIEGDEEDEDDEDDEAEEAMMWQDIRDDAVAAHEAGEDPDMDPALLPAMPIMDDVDDEGEMLSEEEDFANDLVMETNTVEALEFSMARGMFGGVQRRPRAAEEDNDLQVFGRRAGGLPPPEATIHPLLLDASVANARGAGSQARSARRGAAAARAVLPSGDLLQVIEDLVGGDAMDLVNRLMARTAGAGGGIPEGIELSIAPGTAMTLARSQELLQQATARIRAAHGPAEPRHELRDMDPLLTLQRWTEEAKIIHGDHVAQRAGALANHVTVSLIPAAIETASKAKAEKEREEQESAARLKTAEEAAAALEKAKAALEESKAALEREDEEVAAAQAASVDENKPSKPTATSEDVPMDGPFPATESTPIETPMETAEAPTATPEVVVPDTTDAPPAVEVDTEMADGSIPNRSDDAQSPDVSPEAGPSFVTEPTAAPARVVVMIHGEEVDITETGIDPTFLEALPDDMREEVLNQHVRDQRAATVERPADSQISNEFLDALPAELRAEIIQQERMEQSRRQQPPPVPAGQSAAASGPPAVAAEIDPASFLASLDPQLRQTVLMDSDEAFLQSLPAHMLAELGASRERDVADRRSAVAAELARRTAAAGNRAPAAPRKPTVAHDAIQLLDKSGVAVLVRLLFFPQVLRKNLLFKILVNLCENAKTRTELFNLLLSILQDGTGDLAAVDKSFSQLSVRGSKPAAQQTPKAAGKQKATDFLTALALPNLQNEALPDLIAQRCLEGLTFIVSANETSSLFFLTEHELPAGLRRAASKKGKGKEKAMPQSYFPIVLLLGLLDKQSLLKTPSIMESVVGLLSTVTRPLVQLEEAKKKAEAEAAAAAAMETGAGSSSQTGSAPTSTDAPTTDGPSVGSSAESSTTDAPQEETTPSASAVSAPSAVPAVPPPTATALPAGATKVESVESKILLANPPQIPAAVLRLIVNILTIGECSARTFQQSLALIQHLSYIPDARDVIAQELKSKAQEFGHSLHTDLDELVAALQGSEADILISSVASKFSAASSEQAKLLRVLKTIDYMYSAKTSKGEGNDVEKVQAIYESFRFTPLWKRLGDCLAIVAEKPETEHVATVLLPLIEALMVVCKYVGSKSASATRILRASSSPRSPTTPRESMEDLFVVFTDSHRKVLNLMVRNNPSLMSGSFSLLVHNPRVLDFDNKRNYFNQQVHRRPHGGREHHPTLQLNVRRARVFEDSFQYLQRKTGEQIKNGKLSVRFYDEEGVDAGGVTREWFQILARQMFDPNNALFQPCAADKLTYQPNKNSWVNPEHLSFFKFVGRVIGKAIYDGRLLDAHFARSLYRQLLAKPVDYKDVEWVDPEYYNSLCWILENDPTVLDLTFSVEADEFGVNRIVPLKEGGETLPVTQDNKREFVQLSAQYRLHSSIKEQIDSLTSGFYEIIPLDVISIFNEQELELLISGTPDINVDEWRAATDYNGYSGSDPVIVWWWRALKSFNRDERAKVLSFATGTSRVPLSGFVDLQGVQGVQRFSIHRAYGDADRLPQAHTCFNQIDLPQYSSYEKLRHQLLLAVSEGGEGFGFA